MEGKSFKIISAPSGRELVALVNKEMEKGWIPTGMYTTDFRGNFNVYQGMMKPVVEQNPSSIVEDTENPSGGTRRKTRRRNRTDSVMLRKK
jgi:hypothetical protein